MKKLLVLVGLAIFSFFSIQQEAKAWKRGSWMVVYDGGTSPSGAECMSSWSRTCKTGDTRAYLEIK